jgi:hypothetical protein
MHPNALPIWSPPCSSSAPRYLPSWTPQDCDVFLFLDSKKHFAHIADVIEHFVHETLDSNEKFRVGPGKRQSQRSACRLLRLDVPDQKSGLEVSIPISRCLAVCLASLSSQSSVENWELVRRFHGRLLDYHGHCFRNMCKSNLVKRPSYLAYCHCRQEMWSAVGTIRYVKASIGIGISRSTGSYHTNALRTPFRRASLVRIWIQRLRECYKSR